MAAPPSLNADAFFERFKGHFPTKRMEDECDGDLMALIVIDDVPVEIVNEVLNENGNKTGAQYLWLADKYENLRDFDGIGHEGTITPIDPSWRSPFVGKSPVDAIEFIRQAPKPPKPLDKTFCAVLKKDLYENSKQLLICKAIDGQREPETIPIRFQKAGVFFVTFAREDWDEAYDEQKII